MSMRELAPASFGEKIKAVRVSRGLSAEEVAEMSGIPLHTYRRYERGDIDKLPFDHVIALGKVHHLSPDEVATLAGLWSLPQVLELDDRITRLTTSLGNFLQELPSKRRELLMSLIHYLMDAERMRGDEAIQESNVSVLPQWLRQRISGAEENSTAVSTA
jgi:transcriptional regulator with XRE-family HTH domain